jgi:hypothetical protein
MKYLLIAILFFACKAKSPKEEVVPAWETQNINAPACDLILPDNVKIVKLGDSIYTATCHLGVMVVVKDQVGDFMMIESADIEYFKDTCALKEDLRKFTLGEMLKYRTQRMNNQNLQKQLDNL